MTGRTDRRVAPVLLHHAGITAGASVLYIWAYFLTVDVVAPLQAAAFPHMVMSVLFLPHGVRVLAAWLYGWRAVAYLLPGALLCNLHFAGEAAFSAPILAGTLASLVAAPIAFSLLHRLWPSVAIEPGRTRMLTVLGTGLAASVLNLTALRLAFGLGPMEGAVIFAGDSAGLVAALLIVWGVLRLLRRSG